MEYFSRCPRSVWYDLPPLPDETSASEFYMNDVSGVIYYEIIELIEVRDLRKVFTQNVGRASIWRKLIARPETTSLVALDGLNLDVGEGEFFSLLGPNGAGKTSTVKILCTLLLPDGGSCRVAGLDVVRDAREVRRQIGVSIRGERSVYWRLTGRQNLEYFASLYGIRGRTARSRVEEVARVVGLEDRIDDYVERYSMGMKQRLAIGASLVHRPRILMLDEPTIGLDPHGARALRTLIREELCEAEGVTVLYTTHYMQEADDMSDRVAIIHQGRKVAEGTPSQMRDMAGDNRMVEIQVDAAGERVVSILGEHPAVDRVLATRVEAGYSYVRLRTKEPLRSVGRLSLDERLSGVHVRAINLIQPTLEDAFIALTGATISDAGDAE